MLVFQASLQGLLLQFLWPDYPAWSRISLAIFIPLANGLTGLFCLEFFRLREFRPILATALRASTGLSFLVIPLALSVDYSVSIPVATYYVLFTGSLITVTCLLSQPLRFADRRIFSIGWLCLSMGWLALLMNKFAFIEINPLTENSAQFCSAVGSLLIAVALAAHYRLNRLRHRIRHPHPPAAKRQKMAYTEKPNSPSVSPAHPEAVS
jgi:hypothetical protein